MDKKGFRDFINTQKFSLEWESVQAVQTLVSKGATVQFIARYQKDKTGNLSEIQIREIISACEKYKELTNQKELILNHIQKQRTLTEELKKRILSCWDSFELERFYKPYKTGNKTKAVLAEKAGLDFLAQWIWDLGQGKISSETSLEIKAKEFINPKMGFFTYQEVLNGAKNIIVKKIAGNPRLYNLIKESFFQKGILQSEVGKKVKTKSKYEFYFKYEEKLSTLFSGRNLHHYLTLYRGWKEGELVLSLKNPEEKELLEKLKNFVCPREQTLSKDFLIEACHSALSVHVKPLLTTEIHRKLKDSADRWAVDILSGKLRKILLTGPFNTGPLLGINPCGRGHCQVSLIDGEGHFISNTVLKIHGEKAEEKTKNLFSGLFKQIEVHAISLGQNKDFSEVEIFIRKILKTTDKKIPVILVEGGTALAYSTSEAAVREFPDKKPAVRAAIFIARRLGDPLSELVKVKPENIELSPYQKDVSEDFLKKSLNSVIENCVHFVGVDINRASEHLLKYVSGIGLDLAGKIVRDRKKNGFFKSRDELTRVSGWSSASYKQAVGFLRVREKGESLLDKTGIHPERFRALRDMSKELEENISGLFGEGADKLLNLKEKWSKLIGAFTFDSILEELRGKGEDPRRPFKIFQFHEDIFSIEDLKEKMICNGLVSNVTHFGVFVNIGAGQDGLVHFSETGSKRNPLERFHSGDRVSVMIKAIDREKKQINLTMKFGEKTKTSKNQRGSGKRPTSVKSGTKSRKKSKGKAPGNRPSQPKTPFNNPFEALKELKKK